MRFSEKLIELRKKAGLSQEELGYKLNVTRQTISKWELGQTKPDTDKLMDICKLFDVSIEYFTNDDIELNNNDKIEVNNNELKPRKWLLVLLIIIELIIAVLLINRLIVNNEKRIEEKGNFINNIFNQISGDKDKKESKAENSISNFFNKMQEESESFDRNSFNNSFEIYSGTKSGYFVYYIIDEAITNNKTNKDRILTVIFEEINTTDPTEMKNLKQRISERDKYEVSLDYDDKGYVSIITIEKR